MSKGISQNFQKFFSNFSYVFVKSFCFNAAEASALTEVQEHHLCDLLCKTFLCQYLFFVSIFFVSFFSFVHIFSFFSIFSFVSSFHFKSSLSSQWLSDWRERSDVVTSLWSLSCGVGWGMREEGWGAHYGLSGETSIKFK